MALISPYFLITVHNEKHTKGQVKEHKVFTDEKLPRIQIFKKL
jgi:hypothetical protein